MRHSYKQFCSSKAARTGCKAEPTCSEGSALRSLAASAVQAPRELRQQGLPILLHSSTYRGSSALPLQCQAAILVWMAASCTPALAYTRCHSPRLPNQAGQGLEGGAPRVSSNPCMQA